MSRLLLRPVASILGTAALVVAAGAVAVHLWPGTQKVTLAAVAVSPVLFVAAAVIAVVCLLSIRAVLRMVVAVAVIAAGVWMQAPLFTGSAPIRSSAAPLTVLTSNLQLGQGDIATLASLVREKKVDFLAVEELTDDAAQRIAASTIAQDLPHSFTRPVMLADGTGLYSRYPLTGATSVPGFVLQAISAVANVPGRGPVQVFALHPVPPLQAELWKSELDRISALLHGVPEPRPVIALGDYNATYDHVQFRRILAQGYRDAGEAAGAGWLPTYPTDKPYPAMVGIDHVVIRGLGAADVSRLTIPGSDHRALLARVG